MSPGRGRHRVRSLAADRSEPATFFCGGSRNVAAFIDPYDDVYVLEVDLDTLHERLDRRPRGEWGSLPSERDLVVRLHRTKEDVHRHGVAVDATRPLAHVVDDVLRHAGLDAPG